MSPNLLDASAGSRPWIFRAFFFAAFGFLLYQLFRILTPFFDGIMVAVTLAMVFYPLHARFLRWTRGRANLAAGASVATLLLIVVIPTVFFIGILGKQAAALYPWVEEQVRTLRENPNTVMNRLPPAAQRLWARAETLLEKTDFNPQEILLRNVERLGGQLSVTGAAALKNLLFFLFQTLVMLFTLFFLFRDGAGLVLRLMELTPMEARYKEHILLRLNQTLTAVVRGMFITASVQGILAGIGFAVAGVRFSVLLGFASAFLALIPFVGAASVWIPVCAFLILKGWVVQGVLLLIWSAGVVSSVDNFLRPYLIGEKAKLPIVLLFFGTLGGLQAYGPMGLFIGPVVVACLLAFTKIYAEQLKGLQDKKPAEPPAAPPAA